MNRINRVKGVALLAVGLVLIGLGLNGSGMFGSETSRLFTGTAADRALWFVPGGIGSTVMGILTMLKGPGRW